MTATATTTGNTFSSATPSLLVSTDAGANYGTSRPGFNASGLIPGSSSAPQPFILKNGNSGADLPVTLKLNPLAANTLPGPDVTITVACANHNAVTQLYSDWISTGYDIGTVANNDTLNCSMTAALNSGVDNSDAGKAAVFDAVFSSSIGQ